MNTSRISRCLPVLCWALLTPSLAIAGGDSHGFDWRVHGLYVIDFALVAWLFVKFGREPLKNFLSNRRSTIMEEIETAQKLQAEAAEKLAECEARLAELEAEKQRIHDDFVASGRRERDRLIAEATALSERLAADAKNRIEQETKRLINSLEREAVDQAVAIAMQSAKGRLDASNQAGLINAAVDAFEAQA